MNRVKIERSIGFAILALVVLLGMIGIFGSSVVYIKTLIGIALGYTLMRGSLGFAGMGNKMFRSGSTKLIRVMMLTVVFSSLVVAAFVSGGVAESGISLWVKPISLGLLAGGLLFGFGAAFTSCCATGVLCDVPALLPKAIIVMVSLGLGVVVGAYFMTNSFVTTSIFTTASFNGVYLPDLFSWDGANGVIGAVIVTALIAYGIYVIAKNVEIKSKGKLEIDIPVVHETTEDKLFRSTWRPVTSALVIAVLLGMLYIKTGAGWGASTVFGNWMGTLLVNLGIDEAALQSFTNSKLNLNVSLLADAGSMQNIGIMLGALMFFLLAGNFTEQFKQGLKIKPLEIVFFMVGGFIMGFGTRIALGCNVGAFFTPVTNFSLAGWVFFVMMIGGGYFGNRVFKWFYTSVVR